MAPRAFPQGVERLVRRATIVNSAEDIRRVTTQCLADGTPCVLELGDNIVCSAGFTIPGGLKAFSIDGAQRFKLIVSESMPFLFHAKGATDDNAGPVIISNTTITVKSGAQLACVALVEQLPLSAYTIKTTSITLQDVHVDALDGVTQRCTNLLALPTVAGFRFGIARLERVTTRGVLSLVDAGDSSALWILTANVLGLGGDGDPGSLIGQGSGTASFVDSVFSQVSGEYEVNTGEFSTGNVWQALTSTLSGATFTTNAAGASQKQTLLRVDLARSLSVGDVDLDNISVPAAPSLGLADWWHEARFGSNNAAAMDFFVGAAVSSGTNTTAIPAAAVDGGIPAGVFLRSNTTANGGYRYQTSSLVGDRFGVTSHKYWCQFRWRTAFAGRTVFLGFHDSATVADPVDGAYFKVTTNIVSAVTANNSTRTTNATTVTLSLDVIYTFDVEVNAAGNSARFRVYAGTSATPILDVTNTTNIPTTSARAFGTGIVATESSTTASDIGILYMQGAGTVAGFERARGQP